MKRMFLIPQAKAGITTRQGATSDSVISAIGAELNGHAIMINEWGESRAILRPGETAILKAGNIENPLGTVLQVQGSEETILMELGTPFPFVTPSGEPSIPGGRTDLPEGILWSPKIAVQHLFLLLAGDPSFSEAGGYDRRSGIRPPVERPYVMGGPWHLSLPMAYRRPIECLQVPVIPGRMDVRLNEDEMPDDIQTTLRLLDPNEPVLFLYYGKEGRTNVTGGTVRGYPLISEGQIAFWNGFYAENESNRVDAADTLKEALVDAVNLQKTGWRIDLTDAEAGDTVTIDGDDYVKGTDFDYAYDLTDEIFTADPTHDGCTVYEVETAGVAAGTALNPMTGGRLKVTIGISYYDFYKGPSFLAPYYWTNAEELAWLINSQNYNATTWPVIAVAHGTKVFISVPRTSLWSGISPNYHLKVETVNNTIPGIKSCVCVTSSSPLDGEGGAFVTADERIVVNSLTLTGKVGSAINQISAYSNDHIVQLLASNEYAVIEGTVFGSPSTAQDYMSLLPYLTPVMELRTSVRDVLTPPASLAVRGYVEDPYHGVSWSPDRVKEKTHRLVGDTIGKSYTISKTGPLARYETLILSGPRRRIKIVQTGGTAGTATLRVRTADAVTDVYYGAGQNYETADQLAVYLRTLLPAYCHVSVEHDTQTILFVTTPMGETIESLDTINVTVDEYSFGARGLHFQRNWANNDNYTNIWFAPISTITIDVSNVLTGDIVTVTNPDTGATTALAYNATPGVGEWSTAAQLSALINAALPAIETIVQYSLSVSTDGNVLTIVGPTAVIEAGLDNGTLITTTETQSELESLYNAIVAQSAFALRCSFDDEADTITIFGADNLLQNDYEMKVGRGMVVRTSEITLDETLVLNTQTFTRKATVDTALKQWSTAANLYDMIATAFPDNVFGYVSDQYGNQSISLGGLSDGSEINLGISGTGADAIDDYNLLNAKFSIVENDPSSESTIMFDRSVDRNADGTLTDVDVYQVGCPAIGPTGALHTLDLNGDGVIDPEKDILEEMKIGWWMDGYLFYYGLGLFFHTSFDTDGLPTARRWLRGPDFDRTTLDYIHSPIAIEGYDDIERSAFKEVYFDVNQRVPACGVGQIRVTNPSATATVEVKMFACGRSHRGLSGT